MIRRAQPSDVVGCGRTMERAFEHDPVFRYLLPGDETYATVAPVICRNVMRRSLAAGGLWCFNDRRAFAAWEPPGAENDEYASEPFDETLIEIERFVALRAATDEHRPTDRHWYLEVLGTDPDWQSTGCGSALMAIGFDLASADDGAGCYLETETADLVRFYERHGFAVRSQWDLPFDGPHMWGMWREAQAPNGSR